MAIGFVTVGGEMKAGVILLAAGDSSETLVGMEFLKSFGKVLLVHQKKLLCSLVDEKDVDELFDLAEKTIAERQAKVRSRSRRNIIVRPIARA